VIGLFFRLAVFAPKFNESVFCTMGIPVGISQKTKFQYTWLGGIDDWAAICRSRVRFSVNDFLTLLYLDIFKYF
jgi:hypothetical protein